MRRPCTDLQNRRFDMAIGKRPSKRSQEFWAPTHELARFPGHLFYQGLRKLLEEEGFDGRAEKLCEEH